MLGGQVPADVRREVQEVCVLVRERSGRLISATLAGILRHLHRDRCCPGLFQVLVSRPLPVPPSHSHACRSADPCLQWPFRLRIQKICSSCAFSWLAMCLCASIPMPWHVRHMR